MDWAAHHDSRNSCVLRDPNICSSSTRQDPIPYSNFSLLTIESASLMRTRGVVEVYTFTGRTTETSMLGTSTMVHVSAPNESDASVMPYRSISFRISRVCCQRSRWILCGSADDFRSSIFETQHPQLLREIRTCPKLQQTSSGALDSCPKSVSERFSHVLALRVLAQPMQERIPVCGNWRTISRRQAFSFEPFSFEPHG